MSAIDFKEIPPANAQTGAPELQDTFELFARELLVHIGYINPTNPNRGADGGRDFTVEELRGGVGGETKVRWLVSCKHKAHSNKSVTPNDEKNILERIRVHKCDGFLGFYSTLASSGLNQILEGLDEIEHQVFDCEKIERNLLHSYQGQKLVQRFFPQSFAKLQAIPRRANVMIDVEPLTCAHTGQNLLDPEPRGIIVLCCKTGERRPRKTFVDVYWCLKGEPDGILRHRAQSKGLVTEWRDIPDIVTPTVYIHWWAAIANELHSGRVTYTSEAFVKIKQFLLALYPYVARTVSPEEKERVLRMMRLPAVLGGFAE
jgi:hypothetical protein